MFDKVLNTSLKKILASIASSETVPVELLTLSRNLKVQTESNLSILILGVEYTFGVYYP